MLTFVGVGVGPGSTVVGAGFGSTVVGVGFGSTVVGVVIVELEQPTSFGFNEHFNS